MRAESDALSFKAKRQQRKYGNRKRISQAEAGCDQRKAHCQRRTYQGSDPEQQHAFGFQAKPQILSKCGVQGLEISP